MTKLLIVASIFSISTFGNISFNGNTNEVPTKIQIAENLHENNEKITALELKIQELNKKLERLSRELEGSRKSATKRQ